MRVFKIYKSEFEKISDYRKAYADAKDICGNKKIKVNDDNGGFGWMFFECFNDFKTAKNQK